MNTLNRTTYIGDINEFKIMAIAADKHQLQNNIIVSLRYHSSTKDVYSYSNRYQTETISKQFSIKPNKVKKYIAEIDNFIEYCTINMAKQLICSNETDIVKALRSI